jgi:hypothetical protein
MAREKDANRVDPQQVYSYLVNEKGVSREHALGMLANIQAESGFNSGAIGDSGTSGGLFQHHNTRFTALKSFSQGDWTNWKKQVDYALTEKDTQKYLNKKFESPEQASMWFTTNWERPSNAQTKAKQRLENLSRFDFATGGEGVMTSDAEMQVGSNDFTQDMSFDYGVGRQDFVGGASGADDNIVTQEQIDEELGKIKEIEEKVKKSEARQSIEESKQELSQAFQDIGASNNIVDYYPEENVQQNQQIVQDNPWESLPIPEFSTQLPQLPNLFQTSIPEFKEGGVKVSELWVQKTGTDWEEAKKKSKTDGTYEQNISLLKELQEVDDNKLKAENKSLKSDNFTTFDKAFKYYRENLGPNHIFEFEGRKYGTNLQGEDFKPTTEELSKFNINTPKTKERLRKENENLLDPFLGKKTVKLEKDEYRSWDKVKKDTENTNLKNQADIILNYNKKRKDLDKNFLIVDKKKGLLHIYKPSGDLLYSAPVDLGANISDAQTVTKYKDLNGDGKITDADKVKGKFQVDWSAGNMSTGAGKYYISNVDKKGYEGLPLLNMMSENDYEKYKKTGVPLNVATSFHKGYVGSDDYFVYEGRPDAKYKKFGDKWYINLGDQTKNTYVPIKDEQGTRTKELDLKAVRQDRVSNGCIRCNKTTLDALANNLANTSEVYILPEEEGNKFEIKNGKLVFSGENKYNTYKDSKGKEQKGQGINTTKNSLNYVPIRIKIDENKFKSEKYSVFDFKDDKQKERLETYTKTLEQAKKTIMQKIGVDGDTYNDIAKTALGIIGVESDFADINSVGKDILKSVAGGRPSTDFESWYRGDEASKHSIGLTQVVFDMLDKQEKTLLQEYGIDKPQDFDDPNKAAFGTALLLALRYNNQIKGKKSGDKVTLLSQTWNKNPNYAERVKRATRFFDLQQKVED